MTRGVTSIEHGRFWWGRSVAQQLTQVAVPAHDTHAHEPTPILTLDDEPRVHRPERHVEIGQVMACVSDRRSRRETIERSDEVVEDALRPNRTTLRLDEVEGLSEIARSELGELPAGHDGLPRREPIRRRSLATARSPSTSRPART